MVLGRITDGITRSALGIQDVVGGLFSETVIRIGVTGLARSGKTVFITSLVANLLERGRMQGLRAAADGSIRAAYLQPQPDDTLPRFDFENHLAALTSARPHWPESTRSISELRISLRIQPSGLFGTLSGPRVIHVDIVDYPGEWLLDLALLEQSYEAWSDKTLASLAERKVGAAYLDLARGVDGAAQLEETEAQQLARVYTEYLHAARQDGYSDVTPGRFLMPGDLAGSPALTFAPIARPQSVRRGSLHAEFERRFEAYKARVVRPFFRDHFARIDRQVVLIDALGAIHNGPRAVADLRRAMADALAVFRPGRNSVLNQILLGKRVEKILFAATKADHIHHTQHGALSAIMQALVAEARRRADFAGAETGAMAIAALRATTEETVLHDGVELDCVRGRLEGSGKEAAYYPGELPEDPALILGPAREGATSWLDADYGVMTFAPAPLTLRSGEGPPHIRLDRAAEFLIGDRL